MSEPVDVIIPVRITAQFNNQVDFVTCIDTLQQTISNFRLILVDDNSDEYGTREVERVAERLKNSILIRTQFQRWWTRAVNLGLRMARTERVVVLNTDVILGQNWLEELREVWAESEQVVGRKIGLVGSVLSLQEPRRWAISQGQDYVTGHAWYVHMSALSDISARRGMPGIYIDETRQEMIHIRSDVRTCWEMNAAGWLTVKSFKSQVGHAGGKSWGHRLGDINGLTLEQVSERWT